MVVYEQTAYWIDGFTRCAILSEDERAIHRAEEIIYSVITNPRFGRISRSSNLKRNGRLEPLAAYRNSSAPVWHYMTITTISNYCALSQTITYAALSATTNCAI